MNKSLSILLCGVIAISLAACCHDDEPTAPDLQGHEAVDLGLPSGTLWATCNIGANAPEEYGDYFAWGETQPKEIYNWTTYKYCEGNDSSMTKYCIDTFLGTPDNQTTLHPIDDAATQNWSGDWRMPTHEEQLELKEYCTWVWATIKGVNGYLVLGPSGKYIFLPAAGCRWDSEFDYANKGSNYWSSSLYAEYPNLARGFYIYDDDQDWVFVYRYAGLSVRPVCSSKP